jgi:hypothetical protein
MWTTARDGLAVSVVSYCTPLGGDVHRAGSIRGELLLTVPGET